MMKVTTVYQMTHTNLFFQNKNKLWTLEAANYQLLLILIQRIIALIGNQTNYNRLLKHTK